VRSLKPVVLLIVGHLLVSLQSQAGIPRAMTFQGKLTDGDGHFLQGQHELIFRIYGQASGGAVFWQELHPSVSVNRGVFAVALGSINDLSLPFDSEYWVSIEVDGDGEMAPRQQLTSAPYAFRAARVQELVAGGTTNAEPGRIRWTGTDFEGYDGTGWVSLTTPPRIAAVTQVIRSQDQTARTFAVTKQIPRDNTAPQNDEGAEYPQLTATITPSRLGCTLLIELEVQTMTRAGNGSSVVVALFRDDVPDALATATEAQQSTSIGGSSGGSAHKVTVRYSMTPLSGDPITFKVRLDRGGSDIRVNENYFGNHSFGNTLTSSVTIYEY
jgi:hypothetical protein